MNVSQKDIPLLRISSGVLFFLSFGAFCYSIGNLSPMFSFLQNPEFTTAETLHTFNLIAILLGIGGPFGFGYALYGIFAFQQRFHFQKANRIFLIGAILAGIQFITLALLILLVYRNKALLLSFGGSFVQVLIITAAPFIVGFFMVCLILTGAIKMKQEWSQSKQS